MHISTAEMNCRIIVLLETNSFKVAHEKIRKHRCQWGAHFDAIYLIIIVPLEKKCVRAEATRNNFLRLSLLNLKFAYFYQVYVSFDVETLFTNASLLESIAVLSCSDYILSGNLNIKLSKGADGHCWNKFPSN